MNGQLNLGQILTAIVKIIVAFVLPVIMFTIPLTGIPIPGLWISGFRMLNMGNMIILVLLLVYAAMAIFSLGQFERYSLIPGIVALIAELVIAFCASAILNSGDTKFLIELIPAEYKTYVSTGLQYLAKPGFGLYINMALSIIYIVFRFVPIGGSFGRGTGRSGFGGGGNGVRRPSVSGKSAQAPVGGINRPKV